MIIKKFLISLLVLGPIAAYSQISTDELTGQVNVIGTAVPFLTISPDSKAGGLGDMGAATDPDLNSIYWNPAKYSFIDKHSGVGFSYTPWLRKLVNDIDLANLTGYIKLDKNQVLSSSLRYFSLGEIQFTDMEGEYIKTGKPNELAFDVAYSRLFGPHFSGAMTARYIRSDISSGTEVNGVASTAANAIAMDVAAYYNNDIQLGDNTGVIGAGLVVSNIGNKISYTNSSEKDFLPTTLRLGTSLKVNMDEYNTIQLAIEASKLLVPTPPYIDASTGDTIGTTSDVGVVKGMFQSFRDAPGGSKEELHEIMYSLGAEYWYRKQFALRTGYFHEHPTKGNRKYMTIGVGLKMNVFGIDFSYLIANNNNNPLANTMRFSITYNFAEQKKANRTTIQ